MSKALRSASLSFLLVAMACAGCDDDKKRQGAPPPPPPSASPASAAPCADGGGALTDSISAPFFPAQISGYCVDPKTEIKTYGDKAKLSMDEVCTMAFDGECEVYKRFGLERVVSLHYVDGSGKGGSVEVNLSRFAGEPGAYGMYTLRVVAGDPADPSTPRPLHAKAAGAIGTGRAYVWRGDHLVELQYVNEQQSPEELAKSSEAILSALGAAIGDRLPGPATLPPSARALPEEHRIANGIVFQPKHALSSRDVGPAALGFYKDGDQRWRVLSIVKSDVAKAKAAFKSLANKPGALPVAKLGDQAVRITVPGINDDVGEGWGDGVKVEFVVARKGSVIFGVGDEAYALRGKKDAAEQKKVRVPKDEAVAKVTALLASADEAAAWAKDAGAPPKSAKPAGDAAAPKPAKPATTAKPAKPAAAPKE